MVAPDHDRCFDRARAHEGVEAQTGSRTLSVSKPADARRQALECDLLAGRLHPAHQRRIVRELLDDGAVGGGDVRRVTGEGHPSERTLALAEQRPDVSGHEARKLEGTKAATKPRLRSQAVAVVEHLRAVVEEIDHGIDVTRHALAGSLDVGLRVVEPKLARVFGVQTRRDVAERVVRRRLVGDDVHLETARCELRQDRGGIAVQPDRQGTLCALCLHRELQRVFEIVGLNVKVAMLDAAPYAIGVGLDADGDAAVERDREGLGATHAAQAGRQRDRARQRAVEPLAGDGGEGFVGALEYALGPDVDP